MATHRNVVYSDGMGILTIYSREKNQGRKNSLAWLQAVSTWAQTMLTWLSLGVETKHLWACPGLHTWEKINEVMGDIGKKLETLDGCLDTKSVLVRQAPSEPVS